MAGGVRPDSGTGVLISAEERREVLGRIRGETASPRRSGVNSGGGDSRCLQWRRHGPSIGSVGRENIRQKVQRQRSVLFCGPAREGWGCRGRPGGMTQDGMATNMSTPEILSVWIHVDDVLIAKLSVRVAMSTRMPSKGGVDEIWVSKPKKFEVAEATKTIHRVWQGVSKIDRKGLCSLHRPNK